MADCAAIAAIAGAVVLMPNTGRQHSDTIVLAPHDKAAAQVCYHNHEAGASVFATATLVLDGLPVIVTVDWTDGPDERVTVEPPAGFYVWPADDAVQDLADGEATTVLILGGTG